MAHYAYILYSAKRGRFYIGESIDPVIRLAQHNTHLFKGSSTRIANDWSIVCTMLCADRNHARRLEGWIKSQKSRGVTNRLVREEDYRNYQIARFATAAG